MTKHIACSLLVGLADILGVIGWADGVSSIQLNIRFTDILNCRKYNLSATKISILFLRKLWNAKSKSICLSISQLVHSFDGKWF